VSDIHSPLYPLVEPNERAKSSQRSSPRSRPSGKPERRSLECEARPQHWSAKWRTRSSAVHASVNGQGSRPLLLARQLLPLSALLANESA